MADATFTDRKDGSGVDVALSNVVGTAKVFTAAFDGKIGGQGFSEELSTTSDGTTTLDLPVGPHFGVVVDDSGITGPRIFRVTDGALSIHERCLSAVRDFAIGLALPGFPIAAELHKVRRLPVGSLQDFRDDQGELFGVHYWPGEEERVTQSNASETVTYPVNMVWFNGNDGDNRIDSDILLARELIGKSFPACPLAAVNEVHTLTVFPGMLVGPKELHVAASALTFRCVTEQVVIVA